VVTKKTHSSLFCFSRSRLVQEQVAATGLQTANRLILTRTLARVCGHGHDIGEEALGGLWM